jgi:hypothetical protein
MGLYNLTKFQTDMTLLNPSKRCDELPWTYSLWLYRATHFFLIYRIEVKKDTYIAEAGIRAGGRRIQTCWPAAGYTTDAGHVVQGVAVVFARSVTADARIVSDRRQSIASAKLLKRQAKEKWS